MTGAILRIFLGVTFGVLGFMQVGVTPVAGIGMALIGGSVILNVVTLRDA